MLGHVSNILSTQYQRETSTSQTDQVSNPALLHYNIRSNGRVTQTTAKRENSIDRDDLRRFEINHQSLEKILFFLNSHTNNSRSDWDDVINGEKLVDRTDVTSYHTSYPKETRRISEVTWRHCLTFTFRREVSVHGYISKRWLWIIGQMATWIISNILSG